MASERSMGIEIEHNLLKIEIERGIDIKHGVRMKHGVGMQHGH